MIIWGKLVAATIGGILYGPIGILVGLVFGHVFDNGLRAITRAPRHSAEARTVFFKAVFQTMGYLAKIDGVVSEKEIQVAREIMRNDFNLNSVQTSLAMQYFNEGKNKNFDLENSMRIFKAACGRYSDLRRFFLELQVKAAMADNILHEAERGRLVYICGTLNIPLTELDYQLRVYGYNYYQQSAYSQQNAKQNYSSNYTYTKPTPDPLAAAYNLLGVAPHDNIKTIKSAYRKLISKNHPDYALQFTDFNRIASIGAFTFGLSQLLFLYIIIKTIRGGAPATDKVWEYTEGLTWQVPSPAPHHTFTIPPVINQAHA